MESPIDTPLIVSTQDDPGGHARDIFSFRQGGRRVRPGLHLPLALRSEDGQLVRR